ncbi:MAG: thermonuclease family protein [Spirochaetaceae bacterium]
MKPRKPPQVSSRAIVPGPALRFVALFALFGVLAASGLSAETLSAMIIEVRDGDTVEVDTGSAVEAVRLHGIDAPESDQPYGGRATAFTEERSPGLPVIVEVIDRDRYGRLVGEVVLPDGESLNEALVEAGYAWWYRRYAPEDEALRRLEEEAREAERGLWAAEDPVPPWEWRRGER